MLSYWLYYIRGSDFSSVAQTLYNVDMKSNDCYYKFYVVHNMKKIDTIRYTICTENWEASCQFNPAHWISLCISLILP